MKKLLLALLTTATLFSCKEKATESTPTASTVAVSSTAATTTTATAVPSTAPATIADDFRAFRDAVYNKQKEAVAAYFDFPIKNGADILWMLCNKEAKATMSKEEFMTNFDKIFDKLFTTALLKVKSEDLFSKGTFTTEKISVTQKNVEPGSTTETLTQINADYNKTANTLRISNHLEEGDGESSLIFDFTTTGNKLKFKAMQIVG